MLCSSSYKDYALHVVVDGISSGDVLASVAASRAAIGWACLSGGVCDTIATRRR